MGGWIPLPSIYTRRWRRNHPLPGPGKGQNNSKGFVELEKIDLTVCEVIKTCNVGKKIAPVLPQPLSQPLHIYGPGRESGEGNNSSENMKRRAKLLRSPAELRRQNIKQVAFVGLGSL